MTRSEQVKALWANTEYREKMVAAHKRKKLSEEHKAKIAEGLRGRVCSEETREKISQSNKKRILERGGGMHPNAKASIDKRRSENPWKPWLGKKRDEDTIKKISLAKKGVPLTEDHKRKISESNRGEKAYQWRGGRTEYRREGYVAWEYRAWRNAVYKRDEFKCRFCNSGGYLHAHHIKPWAKYPELRYSVDNGITLCKTCHRLVHKMYRLIEMGVFNVLAN